MPSTPTEALLDVNVVIASVFAYHVMHLSARSFVESLERFYTTPTVQGGFLRFATRPLKDESGAAATAAAVLSPAFHAGGSHGRRVYAPRASATPSAPQRHAGGPAASLR